jgi:hypothetical protein
MSYARTAADEAAQPDAVTVRIDDDRTVGSGQTSQHLTTSDPTW